MCAAVRNGLSEEECRWVRMRAVCVCACPAQLGLVWPAAFDGLPCSVPGGAEVYCWEQKAGILKGNQKSGASSLLELSTSSRAGWNTSNKHSRAQIRGLCFCFRLSVSIAISCQAAHWEVGLSWRLGNPQWGWVCRFWRLNLMPSFSWRSSLRCNWCLFRLCYLRVPSLLFSFAEECCVWYSVHKVLDCKYCWNMNDYQRIKCTVWVAGFKFWS